MMMMTMMMIGNHWIVNCNICSDKQDLKQLMHYQRYFGGTYQQTDPLHHQFHSHLKWAHMI